MVKVVPLLLLLVGLGASPATTQNPNGRDTPDSDAAATSPRFTATVDRTEITLQEPLRLTLTVHDGGGAQPQLPSMPDFEVASRGRSSRISIIDGEAETTVQFNYLLMPRGTGTFTIPPATLHLGGETYRSQPITVRVVEATDRRPRDRDELFTTAEVSTTEPWQGQQVIYTWRVFRRTRLYEPNLQLPEFDGVLVEELDPVEEWVTTLNGQRYAVAEVRRALFPQEEGEVTLGPAQLRCQVALDRRSPGRSPLDSMFGRRQVEPRNLLTDPIPLQVRPLPPAPASFSGLVGSFGLEAELSKQRLAVGESATLTLTIRGEGNAQMIPEPRLPELPTFKIYNDKPGSAVKRGPSGISGSRTFRKALVPLTPGTHTVPAVTLTYFDPAAGQYRTESTAELTLEVVPAEGEETLQLTGGLRPGGGKTAVRILADDILPIYRDLDAVERRGGALWNRLFILLLLAPPIVFGLLLVMDRRQRLRAGFRRRREARRLARRHLEELGGELDDATRAQEVSRALRRFIGDSLGFEGGALTATEAAQHLQRAGVEPALAVRTEGMLSRLEAIQYGAAGGDAEDLRHEVDRLLERLDEALP